MSLVLEGKLKRPDALQASGFAENQIAEPSCQGSAIVSFGGVYQELL
jgi:hypothetical protein